MRDASRTTLFPRVLGNFNGSSRAEEALCAGGGDRAHLFITQNLVPEAGVPIESQEADM